MNCLIQELAAEEKLPMGEQLAAVSHLLIHTEKSGGPLGRASDTVEEL